MSTNDDDDDDKDDDDDNNKDLGERETNGDDVCDDSPLKSKSQIYHPLDCLSRRISFVEHGLIKRTDRHQQERARTRVRPARAP